MSKVWKTQEDIQKVYDPLSDDPRPTLEWFNHLNRTSPTEHVEKTWKGEYNYCEGTGDIPLHHQKLQKTVPDWWIFHKPESVVYKTNKQGFRCPIDLDKVNWKDCYVIMGCSHVFGVGNPYEDTIGQQIHYRTGIPVINMGVPGGSNDVIFNNAMKMLQEYGKPKKLFILWTYWSRFTHIQRYYEPNDYGVSGWWDRRDIQPTDNRIKERLSPPISHYEWFTHNVQPIHRKLMYKTALRNIFYEDLVELEIDRLLVLGEEKGPRMETNNPDKVFYESPKGMEQVDAYHARGGPNDDYILNWKKIPDEQKAWYLNNIKARDIIEYNPEYGIKSGHGHYGRIPNQLIGDKFVSKRDGLGQWLT